MGVRMVLPDVGEASACSRASRKRTADEFLAEGREGGNFLGDRLCDGVGAAEVVAECQVDPSGPG
jgi:hypothetical protein